MQIDQAIFESDALSIILALTAGAAGSVFGHILENIGRCQALLVFAPSIT